MRPHLMRAFGTVLVGVIAALFLATTPASAHPLSTTAILLDLGSDEVTGQVQLPIDRLAIALEEPDLTTAAVQQPAKSEELQGYVASHLSVTDTADGQPWGVAVTAGRVETIDAVDHLVFDLGLTPPDGEVQDFRLQYDGIVHHA